ncbi:MAG: hypothetical protein BIFFINMI_02515 [Phycisphaerae bacterium]|nr:hypothetical protein [Phycisphaerae bacterium]
MSKTRLDVVTGKISETDRKAHLGRALAAADWFVHTQQGQWRPYEDDRLVWDDHYFTSETFEGHRDKSKSWSDSRGIAFNTNRGRFLYYYYLPDGRFVPGLNWTMGRALFVLSDAYKITGDEKYRQSAEFGAKYIESLVVTDPHYDQCLGAIRELIPQGIVSGMLDAAQAASALILLEKLTGQSNWLRLGRMFCDFLLRHWTPERGLPSKAILWPQQKIEFGDFARSCIHYCTIIPLWHLYRRTGEKKYLTPVLWAADQVVENYQLENGALATLPVAALDKAKPPSPNHHHGIGEGRDKFLLRNDDSILTVVLAAWLETGDRKYLDSANAYVRWTVSAPAIQPPYCVFPIQANNVLDVAAAGGEDHIDWVLANLPRLLALQVAGTGNPLADGGFRGEDEQGEGGVFGGKSMDYVVTRVTAYAAGTLYRLSGRGTGAGFSAWGLGD